MTYSVDPSTVVFKQTRRGVNATATIVRNATERVGVLYDVAEQIVAKVTFVSAEAKAAFIAEAKIKQPVVFGQATASDNACASEYARLLLSIAEQNILASLSGK